MSNKCHDEAATFWDRIVESWVYYKSPCNVRVICLYKKFLVGYFCVDCWALTQLQITAIVPRITGLQEALPKSIGLLSFDGGIAGDPFHSS